MLWLSHALAGIGASTDLSTWVVLVIYLSSMALAGAIYGRIFMRAANDQRGGWLFGISYGFLLWMLGPVTILQWIVGSPIVTGEPAQGLLATHLVYGLGLGAAFPYIHRLIQIKARAVRPL